MTDWSVFDDPVRQQDPAGDEGDHECPGRGGEPGGDGVGRLPHRGTDGCLASFTAADLGGANFTGANLSQAAFTSANLTGANLSGANLTEVNFLGADLATVNMTGATFCNTFMPDGTIKNPSKTGCP